MLRSKVIITGGAGFIGSQLVRALLKHATPHDSILVVDSVEAFKQRPCTQSFRDRINCLEIDEFLKKLTQFKADVIFHMGASSSTEEYREDFLKKVNVDYSKTLWDYCVQEKISFFYASSAATYGDGSLGFDDDPAKFSQLKPLNPYGRSKLAFDLIVQKDLEKGKEPPRWAGFKFFNVYGPGEEHKGTQASVLWSARKQIKDKGIIKLFKSHRPEYKDGEQLRDFVYVGDITECLISFYKKTAKNGIYNLGSGQARSFKDLAHAVAAAYKVPAQIEYIPMPEHLRPHYQYFTEAKMNRLLNSGAEFKSTTLEEGIRLSIEDIENT
jgi:ADP-L-glycero-D-manno-heptose 6-epimerase